ncbi:hypothetical protein [Hymenobacter sp.]|uniref:hypothetical protein n=1 Tax=Hymenobacter sp. TaxID=1898978 RepID=UPI002EDAF92F
MRKLLLYASFLLLTQCSKCKDNDPTPEAQLPPATQTGAGTFGCLLNGEPWTPKGNDGRENFRITYDPGYAGGSLSIRAYRYPAPSNTGPHQYINLGGDRISQTGSYPLVLVGDRKVFYTDTGKTFPCDYYGEVPDVSYRRGTLTITRLDLQAGVISGTFSFTLYKPGCDSIKVTQGRFDKRL